MENGESATNGDAPTTKTLTREDSLYGDAFAPPTKPDDASSDRVLTIEEDSETEAALRRVTDERDALGRELEDLRRAQAAVAGEASRLEGEVVRLHSDLFSAEAAAEAAEGEIGKLKSESDSLSKALKEAEEKFVMEKEKLLGQIESLKAKLEALEEELTETKQHNASLQNEIGNNRETAVLSAAQAHQDMAEVMQRNAYLEAQVSKKFGEEEGVVVVKEVTSPPNWVGIAVAASTGAVAAVVVMSLYLRLRKQQ